MRTKLMQVFKKEQPLGPDDASKIPDELLHIVSTEIANLKTIIRRYPTYIFGRRGSGKTTYLHLASSSRKDSINVPIQLSEALATLSQLLGSDDHESPTYVENVALLWDFSIHLIICQFYSMHNPLDNDVKDFVAKYNDLLPTTHSGKHNNIVNEVLWHIVKKLQSADNNVWYSTIATLISRTAGMSLHDCKKRVLRYLKNDNTRINHINVYIDSIEDYNYGNFVSITLLRGLLKFLGGYDEQRIHIAIAFPAEHKQLLTSISSNPLKDFGRTEDIIWNVDDLIIMVANRLAIFLNLYYYDIYQIEYVSKNNIHDYSQALELINQLFPENLINAKGHTEPTIKYIMRHTYLLPRHVIRIMNAIVRDLALDDSLTRYNKIKPDNIVKSLHKEEQYFVNEIIAAYNSLYPNIGRALALALPTLKSQFNIADLRKAYKKKAKRVCNRNMIIDEYDFLRLLYDMGVIGIAKRMQHSKKFIEANFYFTSHNEYNKLQDNDSLVLHPIFSSTYVSYNQNVSLPVYPYIPSFLSDMYR